MVVGGLEQRQLHGVVASAESLGTMRARVREMWGCLMYRISNGFSVLQLLWQLIDVSCCVVVEKCVA
jgi:hypothetical protein